MREKAASSNGWQDSASMSPWAEVSFDFFFGCMVNRWLANSDLLKSVRGNAASQSG